MSNINIERFLKKVKQTHHSILPKSIQICKNGFRSMRTSFFPTSVRNNCIVVVLGSFSARFSIKGR